MKRNRKILSIGLTVLIIGSAMFAQEAGSEEKQTSQELSALADNTNDHGGIGMGKLMETQRKIENRVVSVYKAIENGAVSGYKAIENGVVLNYKKLESKFVDAFLSDKDSTLETTQPEA